MSAPTAEQPTYQTAGLAILNQFGEVWTDEVFAAPEDAIAAIRETMGAAFEPKNFRLVPATLTVRPDAGAPSWPLADYFA